MINWRFTLAVLFNFGLWVGAYFLFQWLLGSGVLQPMFALVSVFVFGIALGWYLRGPSDTPLGA